MFILGLDSIVRRLTVNLPYKKLLKTYAHADNLVFISANAEDAQKKLRRIKKMEEYKISTSPQLK